MKLRGKLLILALAASTMAAGVGLANPAAAAGTNGEDRSVVLKDLGPDATVASMQERAEKILGDKLPPVKGLLSVSSKQDATQEQAEALATGKDVEGFTRLGNVGNPKPESTLEELSRQAKIRVTIYHCRLVIIGGFAYWICRPIIVIVFSTLAKMEDRDPDSSVGGLQETAEGLLGKRGEVAGVTAVDAGGRDLSPDEVESLAVGREVKGVKRLADEASPKPDYTLSALAAKAKIGVGIGWRCYIVIIGGYWFLVCEPIIIIVVYGLKATAPLHRLPGLGGTPAGRLTASVSAR
jgi:hypothetical protein